MPSHHLSLVDCTGLVLTLVGAVDSVVAVSSVPNVSSSWPLPCEDARRVAESDLEGFQALSKVEVRANGRRILASLNVVDDPGIVACGELGLSEDAFAQLGVANGHPATISQAEPPSSIPALTLFHACPAGNQSVRSAPTIAARSRMFSNAWRMRGRPVGARVLFSW